VRTWEEQEQEAKVKARLTVSGMLRSYLAFCHYLRGRIAIVIPRKTAANYTTRWRELRFRSPIVVFHVEIAVGTLSTPS
jgi:hypothetical protein